MNVSNASKKQPKKSAKKKTIQEQVIEDVRKMSVQELFELAVAAGIYTRDGKLTPMYRG